jgi:NADH dehydrogenase (ubiquinone) 1 beta subcomplex subunit 3
LEINFQLIVFTSSNPAIAAMAFNWKKFDTWRSHPLLTNNTKHAAPGLKLGFAAFILYVAYDKTLGGTDDHHHH